MNLFSNILLLLSCLAITALGWASPSATLGESKLLQAMRSTSDLQQSNPTRSLECFQYYIEIFDELLKKYEQDYANCQNASQLQILVLNEDYKTVVMSLNYTAETACQQLVDCNDQSDSLHALACYTDMGGVNVKVMYNISSTASIYYGQLEQRIQMIQFTEDQCTNSSKRTYELNTDQTYINLQNCLIGVEAVPSKSTTITTTTTTTPPTTTTAISIKTKSTPVSAKTTPFPTKTTEISRRTTPVPNTVTTTPALVTVTVPPTRSSSAPGSKASLSSELKKLLHSLTH